MFKEITSFLYEHKELKPALYLVPTPIGNVEDITLRAINILQNADIIACEDTRHTGVLLKLLDKITNNKKLISYFDHNESERSSYLIKEIINGRSVALVSDAGTPCISDPGYKIVSAAVQNNIKIVPLPGATAFVPALIASGFAVHNFTFLGFPPQKKGRQTFLTNALESSNTIILYESSHRIIKLLNEIALIASQSGQKRNIFVAREISKLYEEQIRFSTDDFLNNQVVVVTKGEFVVIIESIK